MIQRRTKQERQQMLAEMLDSDAWHLVLGIVRARVDVHINQLQSEARDRPVSVERVAARQGKIDGMTDLMAHIYREAGINRPTVEAMTALKLEPVPEMEKP